MTERSPHKVILVALFVFAPPLVHADESPDQAPRANDTRLEVVCFAQSPEIRHPINLDFDHRGRLLVIESHTHFRPAQYEGPQHDRVRILEDTDGDGRADRYGTFFEGTKFTMDVAVHHDGSVYVATRSEILRLEDADQDGVADRQRQIVRLETKGDYPHNGLSGLAFDFQGNLLFGLGENLGARYRLVGADGITISDEGEGGNIFTCTASGRELRRVATGFWNPFGVTIDVFGRVWAIDNDPDAMPPCRLLHVVEGGDYGYQFRYGRSGRHPFQAWNGQLPGTLPMAAGTGEAPCEVLSYESDGLPEEYLGSLLVTSWADHRVERYKLKPRGASYEAERHPFVQGGREFRPVGLATARDGSLFVSDWVRSDYNLHNQGAIWQIRQRRRAPKPRPKEPREALSSMHRPLREAAARQLARDEDGRALLKEPLRRPRDQSPRTLASAINALADSDDDLLPVAEWRWQPELSAHALELLIARGLHRPSYWLDPAQPPVGKQPSAVRLAAVGMLRSPADLPQLLGLLDDDDPFVRSAAVRQLSGLPESLGSLDTATLPPRARMGVLLAERAAGLDSADILNRWLDDSDEDVRFLAVKWISDCKLSELRPRVAAALDATDLSVRMYQAYATALSCLDGEDVSDAKMADHFVALAANEQVSAARRVAALRLVPANNQRLTIEVLRRLAANADESLRLEAVRALAEHLKAERFGVLEQIARDDSLSDRVRAEALVGLAAQSPLPVAMFMDLALGDRPALRDEALRALTGESLADDQRQKLLAPTKKPPETAPLVQRLTGGTISQRPPHDDVAAWLNRLDGPADAEAGRRVFFHPKLAGCFRCHRIDGRGREIGPNLSVIGRTERRHLLESILQPSNLVPPHYQVWQIELEDGRTLTGMLVRTHLDEYTYVDPQGNLFQVRTTDVAESRPSPVSIMPTGMVDRFTDQELRDLLAYLMQRR